MVQTALQSVFAMATPDVIQSLVRVNVLQVILDLGVEKVCCIVVMYGLPLQCFVV